MNSVDKPKFKLQNMLKYFYSIHFCFGMSPIFYAGNKFMTTKFLGKFYAVVLCCFGLILDIYRLKMSPSTRNQYIQHNTLTDIVDRLIIISTTCSTSAIWITSAFFSTKKSFQLVENFNAIEKEIRSNVFDNRFYLKIVLIYTLVIGVPVFQMFFDPITSSFPPVFYAKYFQNTTVNLLILKFMSEMMIIITFLGVYNDLLKSELKHMEIISKRNDHSNWGFADSKTGSKFDLEKLTEIFDKIADSICISNWIAAWPIVFSMLTTFTLFVLVTALMVKIYDMKDLTSIANIIWCIHSATYVLIPACYCEHLHKLLLKTKKIVLKMYVLIKTDGGRYEVDNLLKFKQLVMRRDLHFSAGNLFKIDFTLLYSMVGALATYIIILVQMQN